MAVKLSTLSEYPPLKAAREALAKLEQDSAALDSAAADALRAAQAAAAALNEVEALALIGDATPADVDKARREAETAQNAADKATAKARPNQRARELMAERVRTHEADAVTWCVRQLENAYRPAVVAMVKALKDLEKTHSEVWAIYRKAREVFPAGQARPAAGGLADVTMNMFTPCSQAWGGVSQYDKWLKAAEDYLASS